MIFDKHIFICVNQRKEGEKQSCGEAHGLELVAAFKKGIKDKNLPIKVRAQKAGCLDICVHGPTLVIYPEGVFYVNVQVSDVEEIIDQHLVHNRPVERLVLTKK
jgi:(2Fe-2S) ferredoxin